MNQTKHFILPPVLDELHRVFADRGRSLYLVGGAVRNLALGTVPKDWDLCTDAPPEEVLGFFKRVIPTGIEHGTVTVLHRGQPFEITTFRLDGTYTDARRPDQVTYTTDIEADLARRDFTMNAMAISLQDQRFHDPFGGLDDLAKGIIRTVGDPLVRFEEDGLRIARAIRFAAQLGFSIEEATLAAIPERLPKLASVSIERFRDEFLKTLAAPHAAKGLALFAQAGILDHFIPELARRSRIRLSEDHGPTIFDFTCSCLPWVPIEPPALRLAALFMSIGTASVPMEDVAAIERRLKMSVATITGTKVLVECLEPLPQDDESPAVLRRRIARCGKEHAQWLASLQIAVSQAWSEAGHGSHFDPQLYRQRVSAVLESQAALHIRDLAVDGDQLQQALALPPSRLLGQILDHLLQLVLDDPERNQSDVLLGEARRYLERLTI